MNTILLSRTCQPEAEQLAKIAKQRSWSVGWLDDSPPAATPTKTQNLAIYAETHTALSYAAKNSLALIEPSLDLLAKLPAEFTKRRIEYTCLGVAKKLSTRSFVKPADCSNKSFEPAVCELGSYLRVSSSVPDDTPVLVSDPVLFDTEYRTIIQNGRLLTLSPYIRGGRLARDENEAWPARGTEIESVTLFVNDFLNKTSSDLPPVFTLDVGFIENVGWAVIEFNPVWCSGFLGCNLTRIFDALDMACWQIHDVPKQYSQWLLERPATAR